MRLPFPSTWLRLIGLLAALTFSHIGSAAVHFDAYLQLPGIRGESIDRQHPHWIILSALSGSQAKPIGQARSVFANLCFDKQVDKSSPLLAAYCARGTILTNAVIELIRPGSPTRRFYQITLEHVAVKSVVTSGQTTNGAPPSETVCLSFGKITWVYTEFDASGNPGADTSANYNLAGDSASHTGFRLTGSQRTDGLFEIAWPGVQGQSYTILASPAFSGPYQPLITVPVTLDGPASQSILAPEGNLFFRMERQPTPAQP